MHIAETLISHVLFIAVFKCKYRQLDCTLFQLWNKITPSGPHTDTYTQKCVHVVNQTYAYVWCTELDFNFKIILNAERHAHIFAFPF